MCLCASKERITQGRLPSTFNSIKQKLKNISNCTGGGDQLYSPWLNSKHVCCCIVFIWYIILVQLFNPHARLMYNIILKTQYLWSKLTILYNQNNIFVVVCSCTYIYTYILTGLECIQYNIILLYCIILYA